MEINGSRFFDFKYGTPSDFYSVDAHLFETPLSILHKDAYFFHRDSIYLF